MTKEFSPDRLDVTDFAEKSANLSGCDRLQDFRRLSAEAREPGADGEVRWSATGETRRGVAGQPVPWLHLEAGIALPVICQRCLEPLAVELEFDRWFRFVPDEVTAAAEDENSEEDVLVSSRDFDLRALIEDELLMTLPITPRHEACPVPVRTSAVDPQFSAAQAERENPFAALGALRGEKRGG
ncbi:MAG: DUF177 domain-containing protein [Gammaproteobacteria bacterium]|nr:DUF177 domain-containing protein [Gammaproteobacteria bacterium]MBU1442046.1 DUF177 domain-containing protein [Gammaproteobacteria bacterium]MBU2289226.1 DUF177 domain-containing protein [Gammaproteobacteria bacterium]MBU2409760.1 DUF177 domain-containing protein [Gammaproteobacteria bacterium]